MIQAAEDLLVRIDATTEQMRRELRRADESVQGFQRRIDRPLKQIDRQFETLNKGVGRVMRGFGAAFAAIDAGVSVRGLQSVTKSAFDMAEQLQDTADMLGLTAEQLQVLRFAAEKTGVSQRTLDLGIQRFTRRLADAREGTGELKKTLEQYDVALTNSDGTARSSRAVLDDLADVIASVEDPAERLRIAFQAFDSEGAALVNTLSEGRSGLAAYGTELRALGGVMSNDVVKRAAEVNSEIDGFLSIIRTNFQEGLLIGLVGETGDLTQALQDLAPVARAAGSAISDFVGLFTSGDSLVNRSPEMLRDQIALIEQQIADLDERIATFGSGRDRERESLQGLKASLEQEVERLNTARRALDERFKAQQDYLRALAQFESQGPARGGQMDRDRMTNRQLEVLRQERDALRFSDDMDFLGNNPFLFNGPSQGIDVEIFPTVTPGPGYEEFVAASQAFDEPFTMTVDIEAPAGRPDELAEEIVRARDAADDYIQALDDQFTIQDDLLQQYRDGQIGLDELNSELAIQTELKALDASLTDDQRDRYEEMLRAVADLRARQAALTAARRGDVAATEDQRRAQAALARVHAEAVDDIADRLTDTFRLSLDESTNLFERFFSFLREGALDVFSEISRAAVFRPIATGLAGAFYPMAQGYPTVQGYPSVPGGFQVGTGLNGAGGFSFDNFSGLFRTTSTLGTDFVTSQVGRRLALFQPDIGGAGFVTPTGQFVQNGLNSFSPASGFANLGGNILGNLLFDGGQPGQILGTLGGVGGNFLAGALAGAGGPLAFLGSAAGPVGAFVGSFLGQILGSFFNSQPPNVTASGASTISGFARADPVNDVGADGLRAAETTAAGVASSVEALARLAGGTLPDNLILALELAGSRDDASAGIGLLHDRATFTTAPGFGAGNTQVFGLANAGTTDQAVETLIEQVFDPDSAARAGLAEAGVTLFEGVGEDVQAVLNQVGDIIDGTDLEASVSAFGERLEFAAAFQDTLDRLSLDPSETFGQNFKDAVEAEFEPAIEAVRTFIEKAVDYDLPDGLARAEAATQNYVKALLGVGGLETALSDAEIAERTRAFQIEKAAELMAAAGFSQEEINVLAAEYNEILVNQQRALEVLNDRLPQVTALLGTKATDQQVSLIRSLEDLSNQARSSARDFLGAADTLREASAALLVDPTLSTLGPQERLAEAERQFREAFVAAQGGDLSAIQSLPDLGRTFIEASREVNAATVGYAADFDFVRQALDQIADASEAAGDRLLDEADGLERAVDEIDNFMATIREAFEDGVLSQAELTAIDQDLATANAMVTDALGNRSGGLAFEINRGLADIRNVIQDGGINDEELAILETNLGTAVDSVLSEINRLIGGLMASTPDPNVVATIDTRSDLHGPVTIDAGDLQGPRLPANFTPPMSPPNDVATVDTRAGQPGFVTVDAGSIVGAIQQQTQAYVTIGAGQTAVLGEVAGNTAASAMGLSLSRSARL